MDHRTPLRRSAWYGAVGLARYAERTTGKPMLGLPDPFGATVLVVPIAVLLHLADHLIKGYPVPIYFDLRFGVFVATAAYAINRFLMEDDSPPFAFLESGRRGSVAQTSPRAFPFGVNWSQCGAESAICLV